MNTNKNNFLITLIYAFVLMGFVACASTKSVAPPLRVAVSNPSKMDRKSETIEINWDKLGLLSKITNNEIIVKSAESGDEVASQVIYNGKSIPQSLIFQTDIEGLATKKFIIQAGKPQNYESKTFGRQVPERFDDFAWENDKVAFRMYGKALEGNKGMAKGIDFWAKKTTKMIVNELYKGADYHRDHGDAVDAYHVGMTLGAGDAAPIVGDSIIFPVNYTSYKILDQGPLRFSFKLIYNASNVDGKSVKETKTISLDAGSQLNKITNSYETDSRLKIAAGVTKHKNDGIKKIDKTNNFVAYWDKGDGGDGNGFMGVGVIYPQKNVLDFKETKQHLLILANTDAKNEFSYYQGGCWSKSGDFNDEKIWFDYLNNYSQNLMLPLVVKVN